MYQIKFLQSYDADKGDGSMAVGVEITPLSSQIGYSTLVILP